LDKLEPAGTHYERVLPSLAPLLDAIASAAGRDSKTGFTQTFFCADEFVSVVFGFNLIAVCFSVILSSAPPFAQTYSSLKQTNLTTPTTG